MKLTPLFFALLCAVGCGKHKAHYDTALDLSVIFPTNTMTNATADTNWHYHGWQLAIDWQWFKSHSLTNEANGDVLMLVPKYSFVSTTNEVTQVADYYFSAGKERGWKEAVSTLELRYDEKYPLKNTTKP